MKKTGLILFIAGILFACTNVKESKEYKALEAQRDSLLMKSDNSDAEVEQMMAVISDVEANFKKIREAEAYISTQAVQGGDISQNSKESVEENFKMINEILKKNKAQLDELNKKYKSSNREVASLKNTIERLNIEMQESSSRLVELQNQIALKDEQIAQLSNDITSLALEAEEQSNRILEQDKALNTAYYVFGTEYELKEQKILSGGFLKATKVMKDTFNKDYFITIDIREVTNIPLHATNAKLWSTHPEGTYEFVKGDDGNLSLAIADTQRFWSLTKYLIIEVW